MSFDDIPRHRGAFFGPDERTVKLIAALDRSGVDQAGFFVTTGNLANSNGKGGPDRIRAYVAAGHVIANHSEQHPRLSEITVDDYLADLDRAQNWLDGRAGQRNWFRYTYLDEGGGDVEKRDAVRLALKERGLLNAYITVDAWDWYLDDLANRAKAEQKPMDMDGLKNLYVESLVNAANFSDDLARKAIGRSPAHVLLLHETDLAAMFIDDLVEALRHDGWSIVTMDEAYSDPIAAVEPDTGYLSGGRVAAIAHTKGFKPGQLDYERTNGTALDKLFNERVLIH